MQTLHSKLPKMYTHTYSYIRGEDAHLGDVTPWNMQWFFVMLLPDFRISPTLWLQMLLPLYDSPLTLGFFQFPFPHRRRHCDCVVVLQLPQRGCMLLPSPLCSLGFCAASRPGVLMGGRVQAAGCSWVLNALFSLTFLSCLFSGFKLCD